MPSATSLNPAARSPAAACFSSIRLQRLGDAGAFARLCGMIGDDQEAAG